jgi:hypothetical protein
VSNVLRKAVVELLGHPVIQRCQLHEISNVEDSLSQRLRSTIVRGVVRAYDVGRREEQIPQSSGSPGAIGRAMNATR